MRPNKTCPRYNHNIFYIEPDKWKNDREENKKFWIYFWTCEKCGMAIGYKPDELVGNLSW